MKEIKKKVVDREELQYMQETTKEWRKTGKTWRKTEWKESAQDSEYPAARGSGWLGGETTGTKEAGGREGQLHYKGSEETSFSLDDPAVWEAEGDRDSRNIWR